MRGLRKAKPIPAKYHLVREAVKRREITVQYTPSSEIRPDSRTKELAGDTCCRRCKYLDVASNWDCITAQEGVLEMQCKTFSDCFIATGDLARARSAVFTVGLFHSFNLYW